VRALPGRGERLPLLFGARRLDAQPHAGHGATDAPALLLGRQSSQAGVGRKLDVDADPIGKAAGFFHQFL
jgi:hypothetical protein